jgi:TonB family protein
MGYRPGMNLDSIREASLDSAGVIFRQGRRPAITDSTKRLERNPRLLNQQWVEARMSELYPPELSRSMIGGRTILGFFIRPDSTTDKMRVLRSSGHVELDRASVQVIQAARMAPGEYHGCAVWTLTVMPVNWVPRQGRSF